MTAAKRGRGRPPLSGEAGQRYQVHLPPTVADKLRSVGGGSLSQGIVKAARKIHSAGVMRDAERWRAMRKQEAISISMTHNGNTGATAWLSGKDLDRWADEARAAINGEGSR